MQTIVTIQSTTDHVQAQSHLLLEVPMFDCGKLLHMLSQVVQLMIVCHQNLDEVVCRSCHDQFMFDGLYV